MWQRAYITQAHLESYDCKYWRVVAHWHSGDVSAAALPCKEQ